jgi:hypothetical protein
VIISLPEYAVEETTIFPLVDADLGESISQTILTEWKFKDLSVVYGAEQDEVELGNLQIPYRFRIRLSGPNFSFSNPKIYVQALEVCASSAYNCTQCPEARANATFKLNSISCETECNQDFRERGDGSCEYCPLRDCGVGQYQKDCSSCAACVVDLENIQFTSTGSFEQQGSCAFECRPGSFSNAEGLCQNCTVLSECPEGEFLRECSGDLDSVCMTCRTCNVGQRVTQSCTEVNNTVCGECVVENGDPLPARAEWVEAKFLPASETFETVGECDWRCQDGLVRNNIAFTCHPCSKDCTIGEYPTDCTLANNYTGCATCKVPDNAVVISIGREGREDSCAWECAQDFILSERVDALTSIVSEFWCQPVREETPPPPPPELCTLKCGLGEVLDGESCQCLQCEALPHKAARYETANKCSFFCIPPYIKYAGTCRSVATLENSETPEPIHHRDVQLRARNVLLGAALGAVVILGAIGFFTARILWM